MLNAGPLAAGQEVLVPRPLQVWDLGRVIEDDGVGHVKVRVGGNERWMAVEEIVAVVRPTDLDRGDRVYAVTPRGWEGRWVGRCRRDGVRLKNPHPRFQGPLFDRRTSLDDLRQPLRPEDRVDREVAASLAHRVRSDPLGFLISMLPLVMVVSVAAVLAAIALRFWYAGGG
jgi:hypothetical protein